LEYHISGKNISMKNKLKSLFLIFVIFFSLCLTGCFTDSKVYEKSEVVFNDWANFHDYLTYEYCLALKNSMENLDISDFDFYFDLHTQMENIQKSIVSDCEKLLKIAENNNNKTFYNDQDVLNNKAITLITDDIDMNMLSYLRIQNYLLDESQHRYTIFYTLLIVVIVIGAIILFVLNEIEISRKNNRINQSETVLRHTIEVQEMERSRISRELHDTVAQSMRYVSLLAEKIEDKELAEKIKSEQNKNIEDIRKLCYNLTPPDFVNIDFVDSINILGKKIFSEQDIQLRVVTNGEIDFSIYTDEQLMNIYRVIQELFQNISKYAKASEVTVLFRKDTILKIMISDDGIGLEENLVKKINSRSISLQRDLHFGIKNILERIQLLDGTIEFRSVEGCGTTTVIEI